ncbi:MAG: carboxypeptidase regulatory-like domain-containing protein [Gammaproteobacteria bacterium]|nr:carboxypeptidase regulatory-like domain-containing protein [Gammaproteobacteria bacterium]
MSDFRLSPASGPPPAGTLTLYGQVLSALDQQPVAGVTVEMVDLPGSAVTDDDGRFTRVVTDHLNFQLRLSAPDYQTVEYAVSASGFGEVTQSFPITPSGDTDATESQISGVVTDSNTGAALAQVTVDIPELELTAQTDADGRYALTGIAVLNFTLNVHAPGYLDRQAVVDLPAHGDFRMDVVLQPEPQPGTGKIQILGVSDLQATVVGTETADFQAQVKNLTAETQDVLLIGKVYDVDGLEIATVVPYVEGTATRARMTWHKAA